MQNTKRFKRKIVAEPIITPQMAAIDQSVELMRQCQKFNCDTAEQLVAMVERMHKDIAAQWNRAEAAELRARNAEAAGD